MLPRVSLLIKESGLLTDNILLTSQKTLMLIFVVTLLVVVFWGKDTAYLREKYSRNLWMIFACGIVLSVSVMQFSSALPDFIYEGF